MPLPIRFRLTDNCIIPVWGACHHGHPGKFVDVKLAMADIAYDVLLETGIRIQPIPIWDEEWAHPESYSNPLLLRNIDREGIRL
jgi:antitoxin ChpS